MVIRNTMLRKIKYGKITIVVFLTVLIWVWTDLALEDTEPVSKVTISVAKSADPALWASFKDDDGSPAPSVSIVNVQLKGPVSNIREVRRKKEEGLLSFEFFLDAEQEGMVEPGEYPMDVLSFLRKSYQIKQFGLTVESCEPEVVTVSVVKLVEKPLTVQCFDQDRISVKVESIDPSKVNIFVPEDWAGEKLTAQVELTHGEIEQARLAPIKKIPSIELVTGQTRQAVTAVKIRAAPEGGLSEQTITAANLGIELSVNLQGKYDVEVTNLNEVVRPFTIRATLEAKQAYENRPFQMTLNILDDEKNLEEVQRKRVIYNFPEEFVRTNEIELKGEPVEAKFKLTALASPESP